MDHLRNALQSALASIPVDRILSELVAIPSHPDAPGAEGPLADHIAAFFAGEGIETRAYEAAPGRPNVVATLSGALPGKRLAFCGHLDTVPPYGMASPYSPAIEGGYLYGRGSVDMKAGIAAAMAAMAAMRRSGIPLAGSVSFAGVADEELGSLGARALVSDPSFAADGAVVGEPTSLSICLGHRGLEWFVVDFAGVTVHGGDQDQGVNAIDHAARFIVDIQDELVPELRSRVHPLLGPSTVNVGKIGGGTQPSTVAGSCSVYIDRRFLPSERYDDVVEELSALARKRVSAEPRLRAGLRVMEESVMDGGFTHQPALVGREHPLALSCRAAMDAARSVPGASAAAGKASFAAFPAWSDAGILSHYGRVPTVVWGPGELRSAHSDGERVELAQVRDCALAYALAALSFCGSDR